MPSDLTLFVPGLLQPPQSLQGLPANEHPPFNFLNHFFCRSKQSKISVNGFYDTLFHLFGVTIDAEYPVAALTHLNDTGEQNNEWYMRCDPACIQPDMARAVLMGHGSLGLSEQDAEQLLSILNAHVQQDGWQIEAPSVDRWYVKGAKQVQVNTTPPLDVLGKDIKHDLPKGQDGRYWCSLLNECQMLLHDLPLNLERQAQGLLPITSLWFWGGGALPASTPCSYDMVYGNDPLVAGLAQHTGCAYERTEKVWQTIQNQQAKQLLVVIDELQSPSASQDLFYWLDAVKQFEQTFMQTLMGMIKNGHINQVTLLSADGRAFQLTPKLLRHWWKRKAKFTTLLEEVRH